MKTIETNGVVQWYEATWTQLPLKLRTPANLTRWVGGGTANERLTNVPKLTFLVTPDKTEIWGSYVTATPGPKPKVEPSKADITRKLIDEAIDSFHRSEFGSMTLKDRAEAHKQAADAKTALLRHLGLEK